VPTQRPSTVRLRASLLEEANAIVAHEYASELSLDDIARRVASSRRQLQRAYAEIGGTTFRDHLTRVRMDRAAEMLASQTLTVREVSWRTVRATHEGILVETGDKALGAVMLAQVDVLDIRRLAPKSVRV
jgi:transcriptional regulator GlxA family with amidase domain